ncbi:MAG: hypothetical protein RIF32_15460 [Leptospirales bacterium]|jgi:Mg/Co/Ni transporter MgtE
MKLEVEERIAKQFMSGHALDAARVLETFPVEEFAAVLAGLPTETAAAVLGRMNPAQVYQYMASLSAPAAALLLGQMSLAGAVPVLRRCRRDRPEFFEKILGDMKRDAAVLARRILRYPEGAAGTLANPHACTVPPDITLRTGLKRLRNHPAQLGEYVYVVDREGSYRGYLRLEYFFRESLQDTVASIASTDMEGLQGYAMPEDLIGHPDWNRFHELPVLDENRKFIGALPHRVVAAGTATGSRSESSAALDAAVAALDDLYRIGFTGMLKGVGGSLLQGDRE